MRQLWCQANRIEISSVQSTVVASCESPAQRRGRAAQQLRKAEIRVGHGRAKGAQDLIAIPCSLPEEAIRAVSVQEPACVPACTLGVLQHAL